MNNSEKMLLQQLQNVDSLENYFDNADEINPVMMSKGVGVGLRRGSGQPTYKAQVDIIIKPIFVKITTGTAVLVAPADLPAQLKVPIPAFIFGQADYSGGYPNSIAKLPALGGWVLKSIFINGVYGAPTSAFITLPFLKKGDMVIEYIISNINPNDVYYCFMVTSCDSVAYGTLLAATNSDRFVIDTVRYSVNNDLYTSQLKNQLVFIFQTLFGKASDDKISPTSFVDPKNNIRYIADIPFTKGIDKNVSIGTYVNYDLPELVLSIFIRDFKKIEA